VNLLNRTTTPNEMSLKIGFIGCGKMAQALAKGFIAAGENQSGTESPNRQTSSEVHPAPIRCLAKTLLQSAA